MKLFLRIIVVVSVLQSVVWSTTIPVEMLNWQMPQVKLQGTLKITNGLASASGTYNIESWHFKGSQVHILDSQKKDSLRLVLYWIEDSSSFSYWSKGDDETFGEPMTHSVAKGRGSLVSTFSPLPRLNISINRMKTAKDSDITLSANGSEGTVILEGTTIPGKYYSQYSKDIFHYRDNRLLSLETFDSGENHQTGEKTAPFLRGRTVFSDYTSDPFPIPMSCTFTNWMSPGKILLLFDWHFNSVTPISDGETAKTVLSSATSGLTLDRWPARLHQNYPINAQKKPLVTTFLVSLGIGLLVVLFLAWLWKRRRS